MYEYNNPDFEYVKPKYEWHIHQGYNKDCSGVEQVVCNKCGGKVFEVMSEDYFTGIRCPECKWEYCIHEG